MAALQPYIALRDVTKNALSFIDPPDIQPAGALTARTNLLLLIHGFNNKVDVASASYAGWGAIQRQLGGVGAINVVHVFWPGSNWESFAVYMQAIFEAREAAKRLARALRAAAASFGLLRVRIVTHSLGARVAVHLVHELQGDLRVQLAGLVVMAAAVPTRLLAPGTDVRMSLDRALTPVRSLFSEDDQVLRIAFRLGESLAGQGFFPVALGHEQWRGASAIAAPRLTQERNTGAGHSDYWSGGDDAAARARATRAGVSARSFLGLGSVDRDTPERDLTARSTAGTRTVAGRETLTRGAA
jgi:pimeloyl-ACP methyl ester carboxylesterase